MALRTNVLLSGWGRAAGSVLSLGQHSAHGGLAYWRLARHRAYCRGNSCRPSGLEGAHELTRRRQSVMSAALVDFGRGRFDARHSGTTCTDTSIRLKAFAGPSHAPESGEAFSCSRATATETCSVPTILLFVGS